MVAKWFPAGRDPMVGAKVRGCVRRWIALAQSCRSETTSGVASEDTQYCKRFSRLTWRNSTEFDAGADTTLAIRLHTSVNNYTQNLGTEWMNVDRRSTELVTEVLLPRNLQNKPYYTLYPSLSSQLQRQQCAGVTTLHISAAHASL